MTRRPSDTDRAPRPTVSVVVPTRNRLGLLQEAVESVLAQPGPDLEVIVVDDASEDGTAQWLAGKGGEGVRHVILDEHAERSEARRRGVAEARGRYLLFLDDDDRLHPASLRRLAGALDRDPRLVAAVGGAVRFDDEGGRRALWHPRRPVTLEMPWVELLAGWYPFLHGQVLLRTDAVRQAGGPDPTCVLSEDLELALRVAALGPFAVLPDTVLESRAHRGQRPRPPEVDEINRAIRERFVARLAADQQRLARRILAAGSCVEDAYAAFLGARTMSALRLYTAAVRRWPGTITSPVLRRRVLEPAAKSLLGPRLLPLARASRRRLRPPRPGEARRPAASASSTALPAPSTGGVLVVTAVPPTLEHLGGHSPFLFSPSGFSPRLYHFLAAVAEHRPLDLLGVLTDARDVDSPFFQPGLAVRDYFPVVVGPPPNARPGLPGRARAWTQFLFGILPATCQPRRLPALDEIVSRRRPELVVLHLPHLAHLALRLPENVPVVSVLEEAWERIEAMGVRERGVGWLRRRWITTGETVRAARLYRAVGRRADAVVLISEVERARFSRTIPDERIAVIAHGVDCEYFRPMVADDEDIDVAVFGLLFQPRNRDPAIDAWRAARADARSGSWRWAFVGPTGNQLIEAVASPTTTITGRVDDVRPYYARSKVVLVPTGAGTGVKTTLLQAWAMGRPVVATSFSLLGLPARPGENVLVADTPSAVVDQVGTLLADSQLRRALGAAGRETAVRQRDVRTVARQFAAVCHDVISRRIDGQSAERRAG